MSAAPAPAGNFFPDGPPARQRYNTPTQMQPLDFGEDISAAPDSDQSVTSVGQLGAASNAGAMQGYDPRGAAQPFDPRGSQPRQAAPQRAPSAAFPAGQPMSAPHGYGAPDPYAAPAPPHAHQYPSGSGPAHAPPAASPPQYDTRSHGHGSQPDAFRHAQPAPYGQGPDRHGVDPYGQRAASPPDRFASDPYAQRPPSPSDRHGSERYPAQGAPPEAYAQRPPAAHDPYYGQQPSARGYPSGPGGYPQAQPPADRYGYGPPAAQDPYGHGPPPAHDPYGQRPPDRQPPHGGAPQDRYGAGPGYPPHDPYGGAPPHGAPMPAAPYGQPASAHQPAAGAAPTRSAFPPLDPSDVMVQLVSVTKTFEKGGQSLTILSDLSLDLPKGGYVALMGPSGSGKSTLLNLLAGLDRPTSGTITIGGARIDSLSDAQLSKWRANNVGFIFQAYNLMPVLNAQENVELPLLLTKLPSAERKRRAQTALRIVGLEDRMKHYPKQLSGGQEQRVAIARAIVNDPAIIIADEPTGDLDRKSADEILTLMAKLNTELGKTIVMVTHDPQAADRARVLKRLDKGRLV